MFIDLKIEPLVCISCGVCVDSCPTDVIAQYGNGGKAYAAHVEDCQACFLCVVDCAVHAISITQVRVSADEIGTAWQTVTASIDKG